MAGEGDEHLRSYLLAADDYPADDVEAAVVALIKGEAHGVNPGFLPPPAVLGAECRRQMILRIDQEKRRARPALPPPGIQHDADSQARVRALVGGFVAGVADHMRSGEATTAKRRADGWGNVNVRFMPEMDDEEMARRLGFTVGDPDA